MVRLVRLSHYHCYFCDWSRDVLLEGREMGCLTVVLCERLRYSVRAHLHVFWNSGLIGEYIGITNCGHYEVCGTLPSLYGWHVW